MGTSFETGMRLKLAIVAFVVGTVVLTVSPGISLLTPDSSRSAGIESSLQLKMDLLRIIENTQVTNMFVARKSNGCISRYEAGTSVATTFEAIGLFLQNSASPFLQVSVGKHLPQPCALPVLSDKCNECDVIVWDAEDARYMAEIAKFHVAPAWFAGLATHGMAIRRSVLATCVNSNLPFMDMDLGDLPRNLAAAMWANVLELGSRRLCIGSGEGVCTPYRPSLGSMTPATSPDDWPKTIDLVVARCKEDLSWTQQLTSNFRRIWVYNKCLRSKPYSDSMYTYKDIENFGGEEYGYMYHLVHQYNDLPDAIVFSQGHPVFHSPDFLTRVRNIAQSRTFRVLGFEQFCDSGAVIPADGCPEHCGLPMEAYYDKIFQAPFPERLYTRWAALFAVTRQNIQLRPRQFYVNLMSMCRTIPRYPIGYVIERVWHNMFGIHPDYEYALTIANNLGTVKEELIETLATSCRPNSS